MLAATNIVLLSIAIFLHQFIPANETTRNFFRSFVGIAGLYFACIIGSKLLGSLNTRMAEFLNKAVVFFDLAVFIGSAMLVLLLTYEGIKILKKRGAGKVELRQ